jgi:hypothetical protein
MYLVLCEYMHAAQSALPSQGVVYIHTQMIKPNNLFSCFLAHGYALWNVIVAHSVFWIIYQIYIRS